MLLLLLFSKAGAGVKVLSWNEHDNQGSEGTASQETRQGLRHTRNAFLTLWQSYNSINHNITGFPSV